MTYSVATFDGTDGADLTLANSGAVLLAGQAAGLNTAKFSAADAVAGPTGARFTTVSGGSTTGSLGRWAFAGGGSLNLSLSFDITIPSAAPPADFICLQLRTASAGPVTLSYRQIGTMQFKDAAGTLTTIGTAANFPAGTKVRCTVVVNGSTWTIKFYNMAGTLVASGTSSTGSMGAAAFTQVAIGIISNVITSIGFDNLQMNDGSTTELPEYVGNTAPTVNAGADQSNVEPWSTVTLTFSATDTDGAIASYNVAQTSGVPVTLTAPTLNTRAYEAPGTIAGDTQTFSVTATDDDGAVSTPDTVSVTVLPAAERIMIGGSWVPCRMRLV